MCDNTRDISLSKYIVYQSKAKNLVTLPSFLSDHIKNGNFVLDFNNQLADIFIKLLLE